MTGLDDKDVFTSDEEEQIAHIKTHYRHIRFGIIAVAAAFCTIEILMTILTIYHHW